MSDAQNVLETTSVPCENVAEFLAALEAACGYRGDVTLHLKDGSCIEGYVFDLKRADPAHCAVRILPKDGRSRMTLAQSTIASISFTGKDAAAGKTWEKLDAPLRGKEIKGRSGGH